MRLQKVLQQAGVASRRGAADIIAAGRVTVSGTIVTEPAFDVARDQLVAGVVQVLVDGRPISFEEPVLFAMHKPADVICSMRQQGETPCIANFLEDIPQRVVPIGRLDKDVSGLLLLTNDGAFADLMLHPRNEVLRKYWAVCRGSAEVVEKAAAQALRGIVLDDGPATAETLLRIPESPSSTALFSSIPFSAVLVELHVREGRHHFVKRLLGALQLPVLKLARVAFGPYELSGLRVGELREEKFQALS